MKSGASPTPTSPTSPHEIDAEALRWFQQLIFGQDKPILENQIPKRLPLDPRAEIPARCDARRPLPTADGSPRRA